MQGESLPVCFLASVWAKDLLPSDNLGFSSQTEEREKKKPDSLNERVCVCIAMWTFSDCSLSSQVHALVCLTQIWNALAVSVHESHLLFPLFSSIVHSQR